MLCMAAKDKVLEILEKNRGSYVSGEILAGEAQVSRAAVWKAITALRGDGYDIQGVTNLGYALAEQTDRLTPAGIGACLPPSLRDQISVVSFETIDSTNNEAKRRLLAGEQDGEKILLITADQQTAGRGRLGRSFYSPPSTGIYMSLIFTASASLADAVGITGAAAVAVVRAIRRLTGKEAKIKWVNDVFLDGNLRDSYRGCNQLGKQSCPANRCRHWHQLFNGRFSRRGSPCSRGALWMRCAPVRFVRGCDGRIVWLY